MSQWRGHPDPVTTRREAFFRCLSHLRGCPNVSAAEKVLGRRADFYASACMEITLIAQLGQGNPGDSTIRGRHALLIVTSSVPEGT